MNSTKYSKNFYSPETSSRTTKMTPQLPKNKRQSVMKRIVAAPYPKQFPTKALNMCCQKAFFLSLPC